MQFKVSSFQVSSCHYMITQFDAPVVYHGAAGESKDAGENTLLLLPPSARVLIGLLTLPVVISLFA